MKMTKKLHAKVDHGVDGLIRVLSTLRRREFDVVGVEMEEHEGALWITLDAPDQTTDRALDHVRKLYGVHDVRWVR
jgi:acetolactate synthase regulatory subunit